MSHKKIDRIQSNISRSLERAIALRQSGHISRAETCLFDVLEMDPRQADAWNLLGEIAYVKGHFPIAVERLRQAVAGAPGSADYVNNLGRAYEKLGNLADAIQSFRAALALQPDDWKLYSNLGTALKLQGDRTGAIDAYDRALRLSPDSYAPWHNYANLLNDLDHLPEAAEFCQQAIRAKGVEEKAGIAEKTDPCTTLSLLADVKRKLCDWDGLDEMTTELLEHVRHDHGDVPPFHVLLMPSDHALQLTAAQTYAAKLLSRQSSAPHARRAGASSHERLRVGYVSADFRSHPTAYLTAELFDLHDRSRFEVYGYSLGVDDGSAIRRRIAASFDHFADCRERSSLAVADQARRDEIDILVDLMGHTKDAAPTIFASRPAPVQVNYLGFPGTMGVDYMDYILVDDFIVPPDQQPFYSENLVWLPGCYQINDTKRVTALAPSREECGLPPDAFVFCCFNFCYKITQEVFDIWMRLLREVPHSVLWLLNANPATTANLRAQARGRNVDPDRIVFAPKLNQDKHLARIGVADLFLDTFPVTAHTTASDALWAGCPIVTCAGTTFVSRVAGSILRAAGLPDLVACSFEEYEAIALRLANHPAEAATVKARLIANRSTCRLFDASATTRAIEAAYERMWEIYRSGQSARSFRIPPVANRGTPASRQAMNWSSAENDPLSLELSSFPMR